MIVVMNVAVQVPPAVPSAAIALVPAVSCLVARAKDST